MTIPVLFCSSKPALPRWPAYLPEIAHWLGSQVRIRFRSGCWWRLLDLKNFYTLQSIFFCPVPTRTSFTESLEL